MTIQGFDPTERLITTSALRSLQVKLDQLIQEADDFKRHNAISLSSAEVCCQLELDGHLNQARVSLEELIVAVGIELEHTKSPGWSCQCKQDGDHYDNRGCSLHTVNHIYLDGCCDQPDNIHRPMTDVEYDQAHPIFFDQRFSAGGSTYRVDARRFPSGDGVTLTQLFRASDEDDEMEAGMGLCFDFAREIIPPLIRTLQDLEKAQV